MSERTCVVDGCDRELYCKGACNMHYYRLRRTGSYHLTTYPTICNVDGCDSKVLSRGMCSAHYGRFMKYGTTELPVKEVKLCTVDGCSEVVRCSRLCSRHYKRWQMKGHTNLAERECELCGIPFNPVGNAKVCATCRPQFEKNYQEVWRARNAAHVRAYSAEHGQRQSTKDKRAAWMNANRDSVRQWSQRRRARIRGGGAFDVSSRDLSRILQRCDSRCVYCNVRLDESTLTWDHAIPLFRGGRHSVGNLLPACKSCNSSKRDKTYLEYKVWLRRVSDYTKVA